MTDAAEKVQAPFVLPTPWRVSVTDDPYRILRFAVEGWQEGKVALASLVEIRGGAARSLGSNIVVRDDGSWVGYVSGGCVESAVAFEALQAMASGHDRQTSFGAGSSYFDIEMPCGGGITVAIHVLRDIHPIVEVVRQIERRRPVRLSYSPADETIRASSAIRSVGWSSGIFNMVYHPRIRLVISGGLAEGEAVARLAEAASFDVVRVDRAAESDLEKLLDPFTAFVALHHDLDAEARAMETALRSKAFYVGALGSTRTHRRRRERLAENFPMAAIDKIRAPIGIFGPAKDSTSLAISILADIAAVRLERD